MKKIINLIAKLKAAEKDVAEFNKLKDKAGADLLLCASPSLSVTDARSKILDAQLTISLVNAQLQKASPLVLATEAELLQEITAQAGQWNAALKSSRLATEEKIIQTSLFQFNDNERACRRWWEQGHLVQQPVFAKYREAFYPNECLVVYRGRGWDVRKVATHFMEHVQQHAEACGLVNFKN